MTPRREDHQCCVGAVAKYAAESAVSPSFFLPDGKRLCLGLAHCAQASKPAAPIPCSPRALERPAVGRSLLRPPGVLSGCSAHACLMRRSHRRPLPLAWRLRVRPSRDGRCLRPFLPGAAAVLLLLWIDLLSLAVAADHHAVACGRRFLVRDGETAAPDRTTAEGLLLSRGRGFMGAVMVDDPAVIFFAGGIGRGGMVVDSNVDVFAVPLDVDDDDDDDDDDDNATGGAVGGGGEEALVDRDVLS